MENNAEGNVDVNLKTLRELLLEMEKEMESLGINKKENEVVQRIENENVSNKISETLNLPQNLVIYNVTKSEENEIKSGVKEEAKTEESIPTSKSITYQVNEKVEMEKPEIATVSSAFSSPLQVNLNNKNQTENKNITENLPEKPSKENLPLNETLTYQVNEKVEMEKPEIATLSSKENVYVGIEVPQNPNVMTLTELIQSIYELVKSNRAVTSQIKDSIENIQKLESEEKIKNLIRALADKIAS
ncbi:MAG: hypothetical protein QXV66_00450 [Candidatus Rehaiarchaeum fermentans]|nr:hypothetical protein [Candidatus Rehaiarchaeum fermentans]